MYNLYYEFCLTYTTVLYKTVPFTENLEQGIQVVTFEAMMKRVVSALSWARVLAMCVPSILETNHTLGPPLEYGFRASVTIRGPWRTNQNKHYSTLYIAYDDYQIWLNEA